MKVIDKFSKISELKSNIQKSVIFLYTNNNPYKKEIMRKLSYWIRSVHSNPKKGNVK